MPNVVEWKQAVLLDEGPSRPSKTNVLTFRYSLHGPIDLDDSVPRGFAQLTTWNQDNKGGAQAHRRFLDHLPPISPSSRPAEDGTGDECRSVASLAGRVVCPATLGQSKEL